MNRLLKINVCRPYPYFLNIRIYKKKKESNLKKLYCSSTWYRAGESTILGKCWRSLLMEPRPMAAITKSTGNNTWENSPFQSLLEWCTRFSNMAITRCAVKANPRTAEVPVRPIREKKRVCHMRQRQTSHLFNPGKSKDELSKFKAFKG